MSSHEDNTANRRLKDLLNKKDQQDEAMDAFEQEALEGFAMLENNEEALELKSNLDKKIDSDLFSEEKSSTTKYWYAAAGLFLVIGFSIYFLRSSGVAKEEKLAIQQPVSGDELQKSMDAQTEKNQALQFESQPNSDAVAKRSPAMTDSILQPEISKTVPVEEPVTSGVKSENKALSWSEPKSVAAKPQAAPALSKDEDLSPGKQQGEMDDLASSAQSEEAVKLAENESEREIAADKKEAKKSKTAERKKEESLRLDSYSNSNAPASNVPAASSGAVGISLLSVIDEVALKKELKETLSAKNLLGKFDASIFIDKNAKVDRVVFTNAYSFTKSQQKELTQIIKELKSLKFKKESGAVVMEYPLVFRP